MISDLTVSVSLGFQYRSDYIIIVALSSISPRVRVRVSVSIVYRIATRGYSWIWPLSLCKLHMLLKFRSVSKQSPLLRVTSIYKNKLKSVPDVWMRTFSCLRSSTSAVLRPHPW